MSQDLMQSLAELESMLKDMSHEAPIDPHLDHQDSEEDDESPYCIKNGAYVRVEDDGMRAWIYLNPPKDGTSFYKKSEIMEFIQQNKVVAGFHQSNIAAIAKKHVYEREVLVAQGVEPIEGQAGYYEYLFDTSDKRHPQVREDGTVDYSSMSQLTNVSKGDVVAIYHPAVNSRDGVDVMGKVISAKQARELPQLRGRGIVADAKDPNVYRSTLDGKIDFQDGKIDIKDVHEISGDVDLVMGKVEFFGDININGNVGAGVVIRASRNITISGVVEAATIYAGGDIVLTRGIQGGQKGSSVAKGNVSAEFIEHCNVQAGGDIRSNSFINANVYAGSHVIAEGKNGLLLGGVIRGLLGVSAVNIGNEAETKTFVAAGYSTEDYQKYVEIFQKESDIQKLLSDTVEQMTKILKNKRLGNDKHSEQTDKLLFELNDKKDEYFEALDKARTEKETLTQIIETGKGASVVANNKIYRGTTICVEGTNLAIQQNTCFMRYKNEGGKIISSVIVVS